jgi:RNA polymerase sigma-70 factor (ECF subfamily)
MQSREDKAPLGPQKPGSDVEFGRALAAARSNLGWAFEWLFFAYTPRVRAFFRLRGADARDEVEEMTNDVFASAFRSLSHFAGDEPAFRSWLFTIARNRLIDEQRRQSRRIPTAPFEAARSAEALRGGDAESDALDYLGDGVCAPPHQPIDA